MSFFSSRICFLSWRITSDLRPAFATTSCVPDTRNCLLTIWQ